MEGFDLKIPATKKSFYTTADKAANKTIIDRILNSDYYKYILEYADLAKIPAPLLVAVIATESAGKNVGKNSYGAIGLGQMKWGTAYDTIKTEAKNKTLSASDQGLIKKYVPSIGKNNFKVQYGDFTGLNKAQVIKELEAALMFPQFNIFMVALHIGQMIDKFTTMTGKPMLHQSLAVYNQGIGRSSLVKPFSDIDAMLAKSTIAKEGKNYVLKILGTNGYIDQLTA